MRIEKSSVRVHVSHQTDSSKIETIRNVAARAFQILSNFFAKLFFFLPSSKNRKVEKVPTYFFSQQYNECCHLTSFVNYGRLRKLENHKFDLSQMESFSRREWLGENQSFLQPWHVAMRAALDADNYPHLAQFFRGAQESIISPHFYDEKGKPFFSGITGLIDFEKAPFTLIDIEKLKTTRLPISSCLSVGLGDLLDESQLHLHLPLVFDKEKGFLIYNRKLHSFESIEGLSWIEVTKDNSVVIDHTKITADEYTKYSIPQNPSFRIEMVAKKILGFEKVAIVPDLPAGLVTDSGTYFTYQMGLFMLMLLATGVDTDNEVIDEDHKLYPVYQELCRAMSLSPENPWNPKFMKKEQLLQYHLAEIFKENKELFRAAEKVVDVARNGYSIYQKSFSGRMYRPDKSVYNRGVLEKFLPGKEQALAYYFTQSLRFLWYSGNNPSVAVKAAEMELPLEQKFATLLHRFLRKKIHKNHSLEQFSKNIGNLDPRNFSFMDVWHELRNHLLQRIESNKTDSHHFVSFDDHGWVISFHPEVIDLQNESGRQYDAELIHSLGFAGIESWLSSDLGNIWYKK